MRNCLLPACAVVLLAYPAAAECAPTAAEVVVQEQYAVLIINPATGAQVFRHDPEGFLTTPHPVGSLIKIFTTLAAMEDNPSVKELLVACEPSRPTDRVCDSCWYRRGHGTLNLSQALAVSCDRYFRVLAERLPAEKFFSVLEKFGIWEAATRPEWKRMEAVETMVGIGTRLRVSPASLFAACACVFNGGVLYDLAGEKTSVLGRVDIAPEISGFVRDALSRTVAVGTAADLARETGMPSIAGKTGTASYFHKGKSDYTKTHGWFVGFAPAEKPTRGICVFLLHGKGSDAAKLAGKLLRLTNGSQ